MPARATRDGGIHQISVNLQQLIGIVATAAQVIALRGITEIGDEDLV